MGTDSLPKLATPPTLVAATSDQYNDVVDSLQGHKVMRDSSGDVEDGVSDIGRPASGRPRDIHYSRNLYQGGQQVDLSNNLLSTTGITSGKSKASGYPDFLTPEGTTGGGENTVVIEAATTNLVMTIDGTAFTLEADLKSDDLALAPSSNNTCTVDDATISGDVFWSKTIGEYGYWINIDAIGSEIESLTETTQVFSITNGADTEIFIAYVDADNTGASNRLVPIKRGVGGTDRIGFSDNDTITLLKAHYIFLDNDLATIDTTTTYPTWSATAPTAPATGDYWWDVTNTTWKRYSGSTWEQLGRIYLGYAICDSADCLYVEHEDFELAWTDDFTCREVYALSATEIKLVGPLYVSVAGNKIKINQDSVVDIISDLENGVSEGINTWYYIYLSSTGVFKLSDKHPRKIDKRLGYYHPSEYWRCLSCVFNTSASDFIPFKHDVRNGIMDFAFKGSGSNYINFSAYGGSGSFSDMRANVTPIAENVMLKIRGDATNNAQALYELQEFDSGEYDTLSVIVVDETINGSGDHQITTFAQIGFMRNAGFEASYTNFDLDVVSVVKIYFNF